MFISSIRAVATTKSPICMMRIKYFSLLTETHLPVSSGNELQKIETRLREGRLRQFGHRQKITEERLPRKSADCQTASRRPGRKRMSWREVIAQDLRAIDRYKYLEEVQDRDSWRRNTMEPYRQPHPRPVRRSTKICVGSKR